jgi:hypothetical protein
VLRVIAIVVCLGLSVLLANKARAVEGVNWIPESVAWEAPGWALVYVTNAPHCDPCVRTEELQKDPRFVAFSRNFNCTLLCWCDDTIRSRISDYHIERFPTTLLIAPDRVNMYRLVGCPPTVEHYIAWMNGVLLAPRAVVQPIQSGPIFPKQGEPYPANPSSTEPKMVCDGESCWLIWPDQPKQLPTLRGIFRRNR